jgi:hypothetical protein
MYLYRSEMVPGFICWWLGSLCVSCNSAEDGRLPFADLLVSAVLSALQYFGSPHIFCNRMECASLIYNMWICCIIFTLVCALIIFPNIRVISPLLVHRIEFRSLACWCGWLLGHSRIITMVHLVNRYSSHSQILLKYAVS